MMHAAGEVYRRDRLELVLGDELADGNAGDGATGEKGHHRGAVAAEDQRLDVLHGDPRLGGYEVLEPRGIEDSGHAHHPVASEAGDPLHRVDHRDEWVRDDDDEGVLAPLLHLRRDVLHDLHVHLEQVVAAHPRLAREAGRDDDHVGPVHVVPTVRADDVAVVAVTPPQMHDVQGLALRHPLRLGDVVEHDVAELTLEAQQRELTTDLACPDEGDLSTLGHRLSSFRFSDVSIAARPKAERDTSVAPSRRRAMSYVSVSYLGRNAGGL
jgi:hypothetical protein